MTERLTIKATPGQSEEILQRYMTWLGLEQLNVAHRLGAYIVQEIHGRERGSICTNYYRDIGVPPIADMPLPELVTRAAAVLLTVEVSPTGPSVEEEIHSGSRSA